MHFHEMYSYARLLVYIIFIVVTSISSLIVAVRMRRRIRRALGKNVQSEVEMTSLNMWMKIKATEERNPEAD